MLSKISLFALAILLLGVWSCGDSPASPSAPVTPTDTAKIDSVHPREWILLTINATTPRLDSLVDTTSKGFRVPVQKDSNYLVTVVGQEPLQIIVSVGDSVWSTGFSATPELQFQPGLDGDAHIRVVGRNRDAGHFEIRFSRISLANPVFTGLRLVPDGNAVERRMPTWEIDSFRIATKVGVEYQLRVGPDSCYQLRLYDSHGGSIRAPITSGAYGLTYVFTATDTLLEAKLSACGGGAIYSMRATPVINDAYEPNNSFAQATTIPVDGTIQTHVLDSGDVDVIRFPVVKGRLYWIDARSGDNLFLALFGRDTAKMLETGSSLSASLLEADADGFYYIDCAGSRRHTTVHVSVRETPGDPHEPDGFSHAALLAVGDTSSSRYISPSDTDWTRFAADSGKFYTLTIDPSLLSYSSFMSLWNADSTPVSPLQTKQQSVVGLSFACLKTGEYRLRHSSTSKGLYQLRLVVATVAPSWYVPPQSTHPGQKLSTASLLVADGRAVSDSATTVPGWLRVPVDSGVSYLVEFKNTGDQNSCGLGLYRADSTQVSYSGIYSRDSVVLVYTAPARSSLFLRVGSQWDGSTYQLKVSAPLPDAYEPDNSLATAQPIVPNGTMQSRTLFASDDWIRVHLEAGVEVQIKTENQGTFGTLFTKIYGADGVELDASGMATVIPLSTLVRRFQVTTSQDVYVRVVAALATTVVPYRISVGP